MRIVCIRRPMGVGRVDDMRMVVWIRRLEQGVRIHQGGVSQIIGGGSSFNVHEGRFVILFEETGGMTEFPYWRIFIVSRRRRIQDFMEAVHVKLADKRGDITMFEIFQ